MRKKKDERYQRETDFDCQFLDEKIYGEGKCELKVQGFDI